MGLSRHTGSLEKWNTAVSTVTSTYPELDGAGSKSVTARNRLYGLAAKAYLNLCGGRNALEGFDIAVAGRSRVESAAAANQPERPLPGFVGSAKSLPSHLDALIEGVVGDFVGRLVKKYRLDPKSMQRYRTGTPMAARGADGRWYGWSHRAVASFGIGDKLFDETWRPEGMTQDEVDRLPFVKRGGVEITTDEQAKQAAVNFAEYVS